VATQIRRSIDLIIIARMVLANPVASEKLRIGGLAMRECGSSVVSHQMIEHGRFTGPAFRHGLIATRPAAVVSQMDFAKMLLQCGLGFEATVTDMAAKPGGRLSRLLCLGPLCLLELRSLRRHSSSVAMVICSTIAMVICRSVAMIICSSVISWQGDSSILVGRQRVGRTGRIRSAPSGGYAHTIDKVESITTYPW
jgi:hypothetical protein